MFWISFFPFRVILSNLPNIWNILPGRDRYRKCSSGSFSLGQWSVQFTFPRLTLKWRSHRFLSIFCLEKSFGHTRNIFVPIVQAVCWKNSKYSKELRLNLFKKWSRGIESRFGLLFLRENGLPWCYENKDWPTCFSFYWANIF